jgi:hypothetical protein
MKTISCPWSAALICSRVDRGLASHLWIAAAADAAYQVGAELNLHGTHGVAKHAHIGVHGDEGRIHEPVKANAVQHIEPASADAYDTNLVRLPVGEFTILGAFVCDHKPECKLRLGD